MDSSTALVSSPSLRQVRMLLCELLAEMPGAKKTDELAGRLTPDRDRASAVLLVGPGALRKSFKARKSVLAANSPTFRELWPGDATSGPDCVAVPDVNPRAFAVLLYYWYTGDAQAATVTMGGAFDVLRAAKKYHADALADHCRRHLVTVLNTRTACAVLDKARKAEEPSLVAACCTLLRSHTSDILQQDTFLEASSTLVTELLDEDSLNIQSELEVIRAVDRWSEAECRRRGLPASERQAVAFPLLRKVVFLSLTAGEFVSEKCLRQLLMLEEYRDILSNIVALGSCPMPTGFSDRLSRSCRSCVVSRILAGKETLTLCPNCKQNSCCLLSKTYNARRCHLCRLVVL